VLAGELPEQVEALREQLGLNQPTVAVLTFLWNWYTSLGTSILSGVEIIEEIVPPATFDLLPLC